VFLESMEPNAGFREFDGQGGLGHEGKRGGGVIQGRRLRK